MLFTKPQSPFAKSPRRCAYARSTFRQNPISMPAVHPLPPLSLALLFALGAETDVHAQEPVAMDYEMQVEKRGRIDEDEAMDMTLVYGGGERTAIVIETGGERLHTIFDGADNTITTVQDERGGPQALILPMPKIKQRDLDDYAGEVERTDETKDILGYTATKYILVDDDGQTTEAWVASIPGLSYEDTFGKLRATDGARSIPRPSDLPDAITLESHTTSRNGRKVYHSYARGLRRGAEVDLSALEVPAGAEVMDMTSMRGLLGG